MHASFERLHQSSVCVIGRAVTKRHEMHVLYEEARSSLRESSGCLCDPVIYTRIAAHVSGRCSTLTRQQQQHPYSDPSARPQRTRTRVRRADSSIYARVLPLQLQTLNSRAFSSECVCSCECEHDIYVRVDMTVV